MNDERTGKWLLLGMRWVQLHHHMERDTTHAWQHIYVFITSSIIISEIICLISLITWIKTKYIIQSEEF